MRTRLLWTLSGIAFAAAAAFALGSKLSRVIPVCLALGAVGAFARALLGTRW